MAEKHGKMPPEVDHMTLPEIALAIEEPRQGRGTMSNSEINERLAAWRRLTPRQKLERGRDWD